ncbi:hypothetical protein DXG01_009792 [Tephrocybe rancida]|nr:hypothetical protein DXG01_009792 [Tephrocybe rancida]
MSENRKMIVVKKTSTSKTYKDFTTDLPETECRYAVNEFEYEQNGETRSKTIFFSWYVIISASTRQPFIFGSLTCIPRSPDDARIKDKMVFSTSRDVLGRPLNNGISADILGTEPNEVTYEAGSSKECGDTQETTDPPS